MNEQTMKKATLPNGYVALMENNTAVLAHNEKKQEYVAWTKETTGGVCWGRYFPYWFDCPQGTALFQATNEYVKKTK